MDLYVSVKEILNNGGVKPDLPTECNFTLPLTPEIIYNNAQTVTNNIPPNPFPNKREKRIKYKNKSLIKH